MANHVRTTLNLNETAILGLLSDKARYGYELDKIIADKNMREWTDIAFSSIYAILKGLEDKGCVESKAEIAGNRVRRHYAITRQGRKDLREAVRRTLAEPAKTADSLMAGIANMSVLPEDEVRKALQSRLTVLRSQQMLAAKAAATKRTKDKVYYEVLTNRAESRIKEELRFVESFLGEPAPRQEEKPALPQQPQEAPEKKEKPLIKQSAKGPEEDKQTLF